jgi:hypothetical protein
VSADSIRKTVTVHCDIWHAFRVYTERFGTWWPPASGRSVAFEAGPAGRVVERGADSTESVWANVTAWDPPNSFRLCWSGGGAVNTNVEVGFEALSPSTTRVQAIHSGWERFGDAAAAERDGHERRWPAIQARFVAAAADPECHRAFARQTNQRVRALLTEVARTPDDDDAMVTAAYASAYHRGAVGGAVEDARAEWLLSRVNVVVGRPDVAAHHARRSFEVCEENGLGDFDLAYAYEGMARAASISGDVNGTELWRAKAAVAGEEIADSEDKELFFSDLADGPWSAA